MIVTLYAVACELKTAAGCLRLGPTVADAALTARDVARRSGWQRITLDPDASWRIRTVDACPPCHEARGSRTTSTEEIQP